MAKKPVKKAITMTTIARKGHANILDLEPGASITIRLGKIVVPGLTPHITLTADAGAGHRLRVSVFPDSLVIEPEAANAAHLSQKGST